MNESSKYTAYMSMYGRDPILPLDTLFEPRRRYYGDEYVPTVLQRLQTAFAHVAINTKNTRDDIKRQADKKARQRLFNEGGPVFLHKGRTIGKVEFTVGATLQHRRNDNTSDCINKKPEEWSI